VRFSTPPSSADGGRSIITNADRQSSRAHVYGPQSPIGLKPRTGVEFVSDSVPEVLTRPDSRDASGMRSSHGSTGVVVGDGVCVDVPVVAVADGVCVPVEVVDGVGVVDLVLLRVAVGDGVAGVYV
jgi:hypothetical protein